MGRRSGDPSTALRFHAVALLARGHPVRAVAEVLSLAPSTVVAAKKRFIDYGVDGLYDRRRCNGVRKVGSNFLARLREVLSETPQAFGWSRPTWTRELLCLQLERDGHERVAVCTMGRALAMLGARLGMARPTVLCPWTRRRKRRRVRELERLAASASAREPVFYVDEVDIHLNPKIGRDWMLPGTQRIVVTPGKNEKSYLAGALDARTGELLYVESDAKGSFLFIALLRHLVAERPRARRIHMILDNYGIHSSKATQQALTELDGRIVLHFLPPYSPDANRIERVWRDLHANVTRNHRCSTMHQLMDAVYHFVLAYNFRDTSSPSLRRERAAA